MTRSYRHLTFEERCQIKIQKKSGLSKGSIAQHRPSSPFGLHPHWDEAGCCISDWKWGHNVNEGCVLKGSP